MSILIRAAAAYLVLLAAVVAVNFIVTPLYHPGGDEPFTVWEILNWFMAVGMVIALAASYVEKRRVDGDGSADLKRYLEANAVFYGAVAVFILFFWNWFSSLSPNNEADGQFWAVIDTLMPIVMAVGLERNGDVRSLSGRWSRIRALAAEPHGGRRRRDRRVLRLSLRAHAATVLATPARSSFATRWERRPLSRVSALSKRSVMNLR